ncbi:TrkH family potassium uptake protein [Clostridium sp. AM58-1XD]|uniref:TrkH family potassium uptake protein n=1 Tax=Clostridium sp. AM58-1XD TaxID=2292307 RepID=UPI000E46E31D|nr:TrkH family potassium uptake protein [Clostridium sp. AM58-1XD]RGY96347.1 Trk family potassium uptake protein [Clostridium sp. AM58-1XD]
MKINREIVRHRKSHLSQTQFIAYGFFCVIMTGTLLLTLPVASRSGVSVGFLDALFTATSATCVTGLIVHDTWSQWTLFGQLVLITLIQIGGLGFITIGVFLSIILRRKIGLKERGLLQESVNTLQIGGVVRLARKIIIGTFIFEGTGAVILAARFIPEYGLLKGAFYGFFHSVSAFCNAGFDLMGRNEPYSSFVGYYDDIVINAVIMSLIVIGGIGFIVWDDIHKNKWHVRKYMLHTKIVLLTTFVLIFGGAWLIYLCEKNYLMEDMTTQGKILTSLFASVTARTAGFNTIDTGAMRDSSKFITIILMFIGGSPGSTAGGVKTTTIVIMLLSVLSSIKRTNGFNVFGRRLEDDAIKRASAIFSINLFLALTASMAIMMMQPSLVMSDVLFETFSAIGTVGMTTGITRNLTSVSKVLIILLMYCGRIGSLSFALAFTQQKKILQVKLPVGRITIG